MRKTARNVVVVGAAGVAFAAAGLLPAFTLAAQDARPQGPSATQRRFGTVSAISGSSITLATKDGATYTVDARDAHLVHAGGDAVLSAVSVGDPIAVIGPNPEEGASVGEYAHAAQRGVIVGGSVVAVSSGELTVMPKSRPGGIARPAVTVTTDAHTVFTRAGQTLSPSAVPLGADVIVSGTREVGSMDMLASKILVRTR